MTLPIRNSCCVGIAGEAAEDGAPLTDAEKANMYQAALQSLQIQLGKCNLQLKVGREK